MPPNDVEPAGDAEPAMLTGTVGGGPATEGSGLTGRSGDCQITIYKIRPPSTLPPGRLGCLVSLPTSYRYPKHPFIGPGGLPPPPPYVFMELSCIG